MKTETKSFVYSDVTSANDAAARLDREGSVRTKITAVDGISGRGYMVTAVFVRRELGA